MADENDAERAEGNENAEEPRGADVTGSFADAYGAYIRAMQSTWASADVSRQFDESTRRFVRAMQQPWSGEERRERLQEAYGEYLRSAQAAWMPDKLEARSEDAYGSYVRALKEAWAEIDAQDIEPADLIAIAQSMIAAAASASGAREAIRQRWNAAAWGAPAYGGAAGDQSGASGSVD
jgi:hypothetical protein